MLAGRDLQRLATRAKISRATLYAARDGVRGVTIDTLGRLAEALDCEPGEFLRK